MEEEITAFVRTFINWVWTLKGKSNRNCFTQWLFLQHNLAIFGNNCHPFIRDAVLMDFINSELGSMIIADKDATGIDMPKTYFSRGIPRGLGIPNDNEYWKMKIH